MHPAARHQQEGSTEARQDPETEHPESELRRGSRRGGHLTTWERLVDALVLHQWRAPQVEREAGRGGGGGLETGRRGDRELKKWRVGIGGGPWTCDLCIYQVLV